MQRARCAGIVYDDIRRKRLRFAFGMAASRTLPGPWDSYSTCSGPRSNFIRAIRHPIDRGEHQCQRGRSCSRAAPEMAGRALTGSPLCSTHVRGSGLARLRIASLRIHSRSVIGLRHAAGMEISSPTAPQTQNSTNPGLI